jgi:hypothetical protein
MRGLATAVLLCLLASGPGAALAEEAGTALEDAKPHRVLMRQGVATWVGRVDVPEGAAALAVVAAADADVDLFVKRGKPVADDFEAEADAYRRGSEEAEVLVLEAGGRPAPAAGTWYVTVEHPRAAFRSAQVEVTAFVDRADGPRTVLPGGAGRRARTSSSAAPASGAALPPRRA